LQLGGDSSDGKTVCITTELLQALHAKHLEEVFSALHGLNVGSECISPL
jgi:hypothetical protein